MLKQIGELNVRLWCVDFFFELQKQGEGGVILVKNFMGNPNLKKKFFLMMSY